MDRTTAKFLKDSESRTRQMYNCISVLSSTKRDSSTNKDWRQCRRGIYIYIYIYSILSIYLWDRVMINFHEKKKKKTKLRQAGRNWTLLSNSCICIKKAII
jgi:hypothetical protein